MTPSSTSALGAGSMSARMERRMDDIVRLAAKYDQLEAADAPMKAFEELAAEYEAIGHYLPKYLQQRIGVHHEHNWLQARVPHDLQRRVLAILRDKGNLRRRAICGELGGISLSTLAPALSFLRSRGHVRIGSGFVAITLFGQEELEKLEKKP